MDMVNRFSKPALILLTVFLTASLGQTQEVATVGKKKISLKEFNSRYKEVLQQTINPPNKDQFLEDLVRYEMGLQEAKKINLQNDPQVQERLNQELYKALIEKALADKIEKIKVTEREMKKYYAGNPEIRTSHILIEHKPNATTAQVAATKKRAEEIYGEVKKSKRKFEDLVALYSDDSLSKRNGGDVGWQNELTLVPSYYNTAIRMKINQVAGLVKTQFGFHNVKLTGKRSYADANKRSIRAAVFDQKRKKLFDAFFSELRKKYSIDVNKKLIR